MGADDGVSTRAGIDLASTEIRGASRCPGSAASQKKRKMLNPRDKSYDVGIILRDLVSLQARNGRLP